MSNEKFYRCEKCKVDTPCEHQLEDYKNKGWDYGFASNGKYYDEREEVYGEFLHSNDFELWQSFCYMKHNTKQFRIGAIAAQREYMRALWILNRFTIFRSPDWYRLLDKVHENWRTLLFMIESDKKLSYWETKLNGA